MGARRGASASRGRARQRPLATRDSFDTVAGCCSGALAAANPEVLSPTSELRRQIALAIQHPGGVITVAVQELTEEGAVNIPWMGVGR